MKRNFDVKIHLSKVEFDVSDLQAYARFMQANGDISQEAYNLLSNTIDNIFNEYKLIAEELEK